METFHPPKENLKSENEEVIPEKEGISEKWIQEKLDNLVPLIQEKWPDIAQQTIKATKGGIDELSQVIAKHTGKSSVGIQKQLFEIIDNLQIKNWEINDQLEPIENQLEDLLDELNKTLRPKIENPIRKKPILSIAIAAAVGIVIGSILNLGRK